MQSTTLRARMIAQPIARILIATALPTMMTKLAPIIIKMSPKTLPILESADPMILTAFRIFAFRSILCTDS